MNKPNDNFFNIKNCQRCGNDLKVRTMSWFTEETICMTCSDKEATIKSELRAKGINDALEGCGYIPNPKD